MKPAKRFGWWGVGLLVLFALPAVLPAGTFPATKTSDIALYKRKVQAAQFLSRTTFGPTMAEIDALAARIAALGNKKAFEEWIDQQFARPATLHEPLAVQIRAADIAVNPAQLTNTTQELNQYRYRTHAWTHIAITSEDQLRQRMAWALSQIFSIGDSVANFNSNSNDFTGQGRWGGLAHFYDMLLTNAFGNYRDLLENVTYHAIMGEWLSSVRNRKANPSANLYPDENYAREIMQLFSIGLNKLRVDGTIITDPGGDPVPTYTNNDIEQLARIFTGLAYNNGASSNNINSSINYHAPMEIVTNEHDNGNNTVPPLGPKVFLGGTVPAGQTGDKDIDDALDIIFRHQNVGPFISRLLIQRFVKSNPSRAYIRRVANTFANNGKKVRGDLKAVLKAILLDDEALNSLVFTQVSSPSPGLLVTTKGTEYTRLREPVLHFISILRAFPFNHQYRINTTQILEPGWYAISYGTMNSDLGQEPYRVPTVFNFYLPDYQPPGEIPNYIPSNQIPNGGLYTPEFQLLNSYYASRLPNRLRTHINSFSTDGADAPSGTVSFNLINRTTINNGTVTLNPPLRVDSVFYIDLRRERDMALNLSTLLAHLDLLLCHGTMKDSTRQLIVNEVLTRIPGVTQTNLRDRTRGAVLAVLSCPECACQE